MKYYIEEINLNKINDNNILNLKKNCFHIVSKNIYLIADNGLFKYSNDNLYKLVVNYNFKNQFISNYLNKFNLIYNNNNFLFKQKYPETIIPFNHESIIKEQYTFKINDKSNTSLIIEYSVDDNVKKLHDLYFLSALQHDDYSFIEDISYFIDLLI